MSAIRSFARATEGTRLGWWVERYLESRCLRHVWKEGIEYEDTGYSHVVVERYRECVKCGAWQRLPNEAAR